MAQSYPPRHTINQKVFADSFQNGAFDDTFVAYLQSILELINQPSYNQTINFTKNIILNFSDFYQENTEIRKTKLYILFFTVYQKILIQEDSNLTKKSLYNYIYLLDIVFGELDKHPYFRSFVEQAEPLLYPSSFSADIDCDDLNYYDTIDSTVTSSMTFTFSGVASVQSLLNSISFPMIKSKSNSNYGRYFNSYSAPLYKP